MSGEHIDINAITLMFMDVSGNKVFSMEDFVVGLELDQVSTVRMVPSKNDGHISLFLVRVGTMEQLRNRLRTQRETEL